MKIAAVFFILSVSFLADADQGGFAGHEPVPRTYPRSWEEMRHKMMKQGTAKMNAEMNYPGTNTRFDAQPFMQQVPRNREELRRCAEQECPAISKRIQL